MSPQKDTLSAIPKDTGAEQSLGEELDDLLGDMDLNEAERAALHAKLELMRASDESGVSL